MDYTITFPDEILLGIFRHLPVHELVRISCVNRQFRNVSNIVLSKLKSLILEGPLYQRLNADSLSTILDLCSDNLETLKFCVDSLSSDLLTANDRRYPKLMELTIGRISSSDFIHIMVPMAVYCPRLKYLDVPVQGNYWFGKPAALFDDCSNLQTLILRNNKAGAESFIFQSTSKNLEILKLNLLDFYSLDKHSTNQALENLKHFEVRSCCHVNVGVQRILDRLASICPKLETVKFYDFGIGPRSSDLLWHMDQDAFWNLSSLRCLVLNNDRQQKGDDDRWNDHMLARLAQDFPLLEELELKFLDVSSDGVSMLKSLLFLRKLSLIDNRGRDIDVGVRELAKVGRLRAAQFDYDLPPATLISLIRYCRELNFLGIFRIRGVESAQLAAELADEIVLQKTENAVILPHSKLIVRICIPRNITSIWKSDHVQMILAQLQDWFEHEIVFEQAPDWNLVLGAI